MINNYIHFVKSFAVLKQALANAYNVPLQTKFSLLRDSPPLKDQTPTQLLHDLKKIMSTYNTNNVTIAWFLKTEFLNGLATHVQSILAAFESHSWEEIAKIAGSIIRTEHNVQPFQTGSDNATSILIKAVK